MERGFGISVSTEAAVSIIKRIHMKDVDLNRLIDFFSLGGLLQPYQL